MKYYPDLMIDIYIEQVKQVLNQWPLRAPHVYGLSDERFQAEVGKIVYDYYYGFPPKGAADRIRRRIFRRYLYDV